MIASSHHSEIRPRAPAPAGSESRPRRSLVLLLSGLILAGVAAPVTAGMAAPVKSHGRTFASKYDQCLYLSGKLYSAKATTSQADSARAAKLFCDAKHNGVAISKKDQDWMTSLEGRLF
jgi:hypothetical protein